MWSLVATALLSTPAYTRAVLRCDCPGLFYGDARLLGAALIFILVHVAWVGTLSTLVRDLPPLSPPSPRACAATAARARALPPPCDALPGQ